MMTIYSIFPDDIYHGKTLDFVILETISVLSIISSQGVFGRLTPAKNTCKANFIEMILINELILE